MIGRLIYFLMNAGSLPVRDAGWSRKKIDWVGSNHLALLGRAFHFFADRTMFPIHDMKWERKKIEFIRIAVGLVALFRTFKTFYTSFDFFNETFDLTNLSGMAHSGPLLIAVIVLVCYTLGICTPIMSLLIVVFARTIDIYGRTPTLGTCVLIILACALLFANAGQNYSIDGFFMKRFSRSIVGRFLRWLYQLVGTPNKAHLNIIYFTLFLAYAVLSFTAIIYHLQDEAWLAGKTVGLIFTNSYLTWWWRTFRWVEVHIPWILVFISVTGVVGQTIFQLFMIPLAFNKWGRWFVILWGATFFAGSLLGIKLSYLPYLEVLYWLFVWLRNPRANANQAPEPASNEQQPRPIKPNWLSLEIYLVYICFGLVLSAIFCLHVHTPWSYRESWNRPMISWLWQTGMMPPNVFNQADLGMGDHWPMIYRVYVNEDGQEERREAVPLNGEGGERRWYHASDTLYFGNHLLWRRAMLKEEDEYAAIQPGGKLRWSLQLVVNFDYRFVGESRGVDHYEVILYTNESSSLTKPAPEKYEPKQLGEPLKFRTPGPSKKK